MIENLYFWAARQAVFVQVIIGNILFVIGIILVYFLLALFVNLAWFFDEPKPSKFKKFITGTIAVIFWGGLLLGLLFYCEQRRRGLP
jgi:hypothetical protein